MSKNISIGDSELEIMKVLWQADAPVSTQYINEAVEKMGWKRTTVSTFLARLADKGAISVEKRGKLYFYSTVLTRREHRRAQTKNLITSLYGGSLRDFAVSLFEDEELSREDIKELRAIFDDMEV